MKRNNQILNNFFEFFRQHSPLPVIILINISIFVFVNIVKVLFFLFNINDPHIYLNFISFLAVPADLHRLLTRPWTIITYMFLHEGFFHLLCNMLILYFVGKLFIIYIGSKRFVKVYLLGGISGAALFILAYNIFPAFNSSLPVAVALGASASVLAIFAALATFIPNYSVSFFLLGKIKLKYIIAVLLLIDLLSIDKGNPGGHIAHLGGALYGFCYIWGGNKQYNKINFFKKIKKLFSIKPKMKKVHHSASHHEKVRYMSDEEYNAMQKENQKKIDMILEKISKSGYQSLSKEEKDFLFSQSKKN